MLYTDPPEAKSFNGGTQSRPFGHRGHVLPTRITPTAILLIALAETSCTGAIPRNSQLYEAVPTVVEGS